MKWQLKKYAYFQNFLWVFVLLNLNKNLFQYKLGKRIKIRNICYKIFQTLSSDIVSRADLKRNIKKSVFLFCFVNSFLILFCIK